MRPYYTSNHPARAGKLAELSRSRILPGATARYALRRNEASVWPGPGRCASAIPCRFMILRGSKQWRTADPRLPCRVALLIRSRLARLPSCDRFPLSSGCNHDFAHQLHHQFRGHRRSVHDRVRRRVHESNASGATIRPPVLGWVIRWRWRRQSRAVAHERGRLFKPWCVRLRVDLHRLGTRRPPPDAGRLLCGRRGAVRADYLRHHRLHPARGPTDRDRRERRLFGARVRRQFVRARFDLCSTGACQGTTLGTLIGTFQGRTIRQVFGATTAGLSTIAVSNGPRLQAGLNFWIEVVSSSQTRLTWYLNTRAVVGEQFYEDPYTPQLYSMDAGGSQGAFEVRVNP